MKSAICVSCTGKEEVISRIFSKSHYFLIFDTGKGIIREKILNNFSSSAGSEVFCAQMLIKSDIKSIICGSCEEDAKKIFGEANINIVEKIAGDLKSFLYNSLSQKNKNNFKEYFQAS